MTDHAFWLAQTVNFASTLLGVVLGALLAWWIARWQMRAEHRAHEALDREHLLLSLELVVAELRDGEEAARLLLKVASDAGMDGYAWNYCEAVVAMIRSEIYGSLERAGSIHRLPADVRRSLEKAYGLLRAVAAGSRIARTRYVYEGLSRVGGNVGAARELQAKVKQAAQDALTTIPAARKELVAWLATRNPPVEHD